MAQYTFNIALGSGKKGAKMRRLFREAPKKLNLSFSKWATTILTKAAHETLTEDQDTHLKTK